MSIELESSKRRDDINELIEKLELPKDDEGYTLDHFGHRISFKNIRSLKKPYCKLALSPEHIEELYHCSEDYEYFRDNYCKIMTKKGYDLPELRPYQKRLGTELIAEKRTVIDYSRQSGKTVTVGNYLLWKTLFNKEISSGIAANKMSLAVEVLEKIKQTYLELPIWMQQGVMVWNVQSIAFENGSKIICSPTTGDAFRGFTISGVLYIDECAFIPNTKWNAFKDSVIPTVSAMEDAEIIMSSTPNGLNHWYDIVEDAKSGKSDFKYITMDWWEVPGRDEEWKENIIASQGEIFFNQNFGCEFLGSSDTLITSTKLKSLRHEMEDPMEIDANGVQGLHIFREPVEDHKYVIGVDTAKSGIDKITLCALDITSFPMETAAIGQLEINYLALPEVLNFMGNKYNNAFIIVENNEGSGQSVNDMMFREYEYENLYKIPKKKEYGFRTTPKTRGQMISNLAKLINNNKLKFYDLRLLEEFYHFLLSPKGKYEAEEGYHDDLVMGLCMSISIFNDIRNFDDMKSIINSINSENNVKIAEEISIGDFGSFDHDSEEQEKVDRFGTLFGDEFSTDPYEIEDEDVNFYDLK